MRYAEVLLDYAEACTELGDAGDLNEATTTINMIRTRAGQPSLAPGLSQDELRTAVRHERRIELAFEEFRFWDVRRWVIGPEAYQPTHRIDVKYVTSQTVTSYRQPDGSTWSAPIYSNVLLGNETNARLDKAYFFPILRDELNKILY